jgi:dTDP-4-dehydrorhamnose reductase
MKGNYNESFLPIPTTLYSLSKLIGEPNTDSTKTIRLSFVPSSKKSALTHGLFSWLINSAPKVPIFGYSNVYWNGITDKIAGTAVANIVNSKILFANMPQLIHLYSREKVSKYELALMLLQSYSLYDTRISKKQKRIPRDFTLTTKYPNFSQQIWESLGFSEIPSIKELLK